MYDQNKNPELKYAQKFERFENNPYASDGWGDVAAEYKDLNKEEQIEISSKIEKEKFAEEITQENFAETSSQYSRVKERNERLKKVYT